MLPWKYRIKFKGNPTWMFSQSAFTCSRLTIEIPEQALKYFKVNIKDTRTTPGVVLVYLLLTSNMCHTLF